MEYQQHLDLARSLPVRYFNKKTQNYEVPMACAGDVLKRFGNLNIPIPDDIWFFYRNLKAVETAKFNHPVKPEHLELIRTPMLSHQYGWLGFSRYFRSVANLCEQGTGKSKMALDWVAIKNFKLVLVVAKNSNVYKWGQEVKKHSDFEPFVLKGPKWARAELYKRALNCANTAIVIINYEYVDPFLKELMAAQFQAIILDESTAIKHIRSKRHKAIVKLGDQCPNKLILTGTPLVNAPLDAFGQFRFLNPSIFGKNFIAFKMRYCIMGGFGGYQVTEYINLDELQEKISLYSYRILKKDCLDLPDKVFQMLDVEPSETWRKKYDDLLEASILELGDRILDNTLMLSKIIRLQQLCDGFLYIESEKMRYDVYDTPKLNELIDFMEDHFQSNKKLIIWCKFKATIRILMEKLPLKFPDINFHAISGETPVNVRQQTVDAFNISHINNSGNHCMILQTASMMHGIDVRCDTCVYYSYSWSNEEWQQSQDRIHGINRGLGDKCTYIVLTIPGTIEVSILKALERKQRLSDLILRDKTVVRSILKGEYDG